MPKERTNALTRAMRIEMGALCGQPVLISVDVTGDFGEMLESLDSGELWDLGNAPRWDLDGDGIALPTCRAHGSRREARRDFLFCHATLLTAVLPQSAEVPSRRQSPGRPGPTRRCRGPKWRGPLRSR